MRAPKRAAAGAPAGGSLAGPAPRAALAALDDPALEAASSKGLLRRAGRDLDAGLAALAAETAERIECAVDGETVVLGPGGLRAARCTCPSQALCRHVLAAVLLLRRAPPAVAEPAADAAAPPGAAPDPAAEMAALTPADLVAAFGRPALRDAERILLAASEGPDPVAVVAAGAALVVRLPGQPEVRYLAGLGPGGMISKDPAAVAGGRVTRAALHAAAVLAARRLAAGGALVETAAEGQGGAAPASARGAEPAFLDAVAAALAEAARSALATAPALLEERLSDLALSSRADALPRLAAELRGIAEDLPRRRARASAFEPRDALAAVARAHALVEALRSAPGDPDLRGALRRPAEALPPLDLVGCGLALWRSPSGARGATAHALSPEGPRWLTFTVARPAGQDLGFSPRTAARGEPVLGRSLESLASTAYRLEGGRATADGRVSAGAGARLLPGEGGLAELTVARPDLVVERWCDLGDRLAGALAPGLRASRAPVPVLLRPAALAPLQFDALAQRAWLPAMDPDGRWLDLTVEAEGDDEARLGAAAALGGPVPPPLLVALAGVSGPDVALSVFAALPAGEAPLASFDLWVPPPAGPTKRGRTKPARPGPAFAPAAPADRASSGLLALAEDEALALAELGGRMEDPARLGRLRGLAARLEAAGLQPLGALLGLLADAPEAERPRRLLAFVHASACLAALSPRLPIVERTG